MHGRSKPKRKRSDSTIYLMDGFPPPADRLVIPLCAMGIQGLWIVIDPPSEPVIIGMGSDGIPLDPDSARLQLREFTAIARLG